MLSSYCSHYGLAGIARRRLWPDSARAWLNLTVFPFSAFFSPPATVLRGSLPGRKRHDGAMKKLLRKLFPVPLTNGGLFVLLILNLMFSDLLHNTYNRHITDKKDVRSFYIEGVFERYSRGYSGSDRKLIIASGEKTYTIVFSDKYNRHIRREEIEQYLGEIFMIEYIKGPRGWFWAKNWPYSITLKDGRQILKVDREEYIDWRWGIRSNHIIVILTVSTFMLTSLILTVLTVLSRLRNRGELP